MGTHTRRRTQSAASGVAGGRLSRARRRARQGPAPVAHTPDHHKNDCNPPELLRSPLALRRVQFNVCGPASAARWPTRPLKTSPHLYWMPLSDMAAGCGCGRGELGAACCLPAFFAPPALHCLFSQSRVCLLPQQFRPAGAALECSEGAARSSGHLRAASPPWPQLAVITPPPQLRQHPTSTPEAEVRAVGARPRGRRRPARCRPVTVPAQ